ncbi:hypothetical protein [Glycomyces salinus]|uniref:hypothetical protein n=1 Tax=Glycomyces salinus TaxID=980294 RepID=UPI0018EAB274|nr:hypothetical protein [Glycomyces salinus]
MEYPRVIRCRAAFGGAVGGSAVAGVMSIVLAVAWVFRRPDTESRFVIFGVLWVIILLIYTFVQAVSIPCRIIVDRDEITFIRRLGRRQTFRWDRIWGFEVVKQHRSFQGRIIGLDGQRNAPAALHCYRFGLSAPASLRYICEMLNYELSLRRRAWAGD